MRFLPPLAAAAAASTFAFRSPTLKLAPACSGGNSMKIGRRFEHDALVVGTHVNVWIVFAS